MKHGKMHLVLFVLFCLHNSFVCAVKKSVAFSSVRKSNRSLVSPKNKQELVKEAQIRLQSHRNSVQDAYLKNDRLVVALGTMAYDLHNLGYELSQEFEDFANIYHIAQVMESWNVKNNA